MPTKQYTIGIIEYGHKIEYFFCTNENKNKNVYLYHENEQHNEITRF